VVLCLLDPGNRLNEIGKRNELEKNGMLTEQQKADIIHKLLSPWRYYEMKTSGYWNTSIRKLCTALGYKKPERFSFYIKSPDSELIMMANKIYDDTINHFRFSDFYTEENIVDDFLKKHVVLCEESRLAEEDDDADPVYFWTDDMEKQMKSHSEMIENIKIKLYNNSDATGQQIEEIRTELRRYQKLYNELYARKHQFDYLTAEDTASKLYTRYLYDNTFYTTDKQQVKGLPVPFLDAVANIVRSESISGTQMREVAHTSPWLQIYKTAQPNPFAGLFLSQDMLQLMSLTRWYEWVREHPDRPDDKVIDDNDMLDGWYILWERNRPKKTNTLVESSKFNVENFIMAKTPAEANEVYRRNDKVAQVLMRNRAKQISGSDNVIQNQDLVDNKLVVQMEGTKLGFLAAQAKANGMMIKPR